MSDERRETREEGGREEHKTRTAAALGICECPFIYVAIAAVEGGGERSSFQAACR